MERLGQRFPFGDQLALGVVLGVLGRLDVDEDGLVERFRVWSNRLEDHHTDEQRHGARDRAVAEPVSSRLGCGRSLLALGLLATLRTAFLVGQALAFSQGSLLSSQLPGRPARDGQRRESPDRAVAIGARRLQQVINRSS